MDMQVPQPAPPGVILSPDGLWRWDGEAWIPTTPPARRLYRPIRSQARLAVAGLAIAGVAEAVLIGALAGRLDIVNRYIEGSTVSLADARHSDDTVRVAAGVHLGAIVLCAILFLAWLHRVVANNHALGAPRAAHRHHPHHGVAGTARGRGRARRARRPGAERPAAGAARGGVGNSLNMVWDLGPGSCDLRHQTSPQFWGDHASGKPCCTSDSRTSPNHPEKRCKAPQKYGVHRGGFEIS